MKSSMELFFRVQDSTIFLERTQFSHPTLANSRTSVRGAGQTSNFPGTFGWGTGVKALSTFLIQQANESSTKAVKRGFSGGPGSLAATLDSVLSKQPIWLLEMFGADSNGRSILHRLISRENPERKRPGPVTISLLKPETLEISIQLNDRRVTSHPELNYALELLTLEASNRKRPNAKLPSPTVDNEAVMIKLLEVEAIQTLSVIQNPIWFSSWVNELVLSPSLRSLVSLRTCSTIRRRLERNLVSYDTNFAEDISILYSLRRPLSFSTSPWSIGEIVIVHYLLRYLKAPIFIDYAHESSYLLFQFLSRNANKVDELSDFVALGLGAVAGVERERQIPYLPFLPIPPSTAAFISPNRAKRDYLIGDLSVGMETYSTSGMFVRDLIKKGIVSKNKVNFVDSFSYNEIFNFQGRIDPETIFLTHFPHVDLNLILNNFEALSSKYHLNGMVTHKDSIKPDVVAAFSRLFLSSWRKIASDKPLLKQLVSEVWCLPNYREQIYRQALGVSI